MNVFELYGYEASLAAMDALVTHLECEEDAFIDMCRDMLEDIDSKYEKREP